MTILDSLNRIFLSQRLAIPFRWLTSLPIKLRKLGTRLPILLVTVIFCLLGSLLLPAISYADAIGSLTAESAIETMSERADIAADKVDQFAQAYLQVLKLLSDREPELPAAETSAEALKIQQSIETEAVKRIEDSGLTMAEYMKMLSLASQDEAFRDKVLSRLDESLQE
jgi:hypothetical protein